MKPTFIIIHNIDVSTFFPSNAAWFVEHAYLRMLTGFAVYEWVPTRNEFRAKEQSLLRSFHTTLGTKALSG